MKQLLKKVYQILEKKQKMIFVLIVLIMIVSAALTQVTPKAIGWLTDDVLNGEEVSFEKVIPFLLLILVVNVTNEIIIVV